MKIAMIGPKRIPSREGGIDVVVGRLSSELARRGQDVTVYVRKKKGLEVPKSWNGVRLKEVFTIDRKATDALVSSFLATLKALWARDKPLIVTSLGNDAILRAHGIPAQARDWGGRVPVRPGGAVTVVPLLTYTLSLRRLPLLTQVMIQFISPSVQLLLAVVVLKETMTWDRWAAMGCVWAAVGVFAADAVVRTRQVRRQVERKPPVPVCQ